MIRGDKVSSSVVIGGDVVRSSIVIRGDSSSLTSVMIRMISQCIDISSDQRGYGQLFTSDQG